MYVARGEQAALGPLRTDHAALYARWVNDPEVKEGILNLGLYSAADEERFVAESGEQGARRDPQAARFAIYDVSDDSPVGICGLEGISWRHRRAEFGIMVGERRGNGLGTDATRLTLGWAFGVMSLNSLFLTVYDFNLRAQRCYEKAGFKVVGRRRESVLARGGLVDEVLMDAIASDFA
jgi:RimJ/RimL family protein N-acetyltransferase